MLHKTPLHALHLAQGATMVAFAGYDMPVQYPSGIKQEHLHTRTSVGLFDVSHMGQIRFSGKHVAEFLERLTPADIASLKNGQQRYALLTNEQGGVIDDCMITRFSDGYYVVVNAARKEVDIAHFKKHLPKNIHLEILHHDALIALQGPKAEHVLKRFVPQVAQLYFMDAIQCVVEGVPCRISRSGYSGEDGFEIAMPAHSAEAFAQQLLSDEQVKMIGLGARDSLRLEAGLSLYGHELTEETTPAEAGLIWSIGKERRTGGKRSGHFLGESTVLAQLDKTLPLKSKRVALIAEGKAPVREGTLLYVGVEQGESIGYITSGTNTPSLNKPIALALVNTQYTTIGDKIYADVRGKRVPMIVTASPFVAASYHRR